jgi:hypothetical protein
VDRRDRGYLKDLVDLHGAFLSIDSPWAAKKMVAQPVLVKTAKSLKTVPMVERIPIKGLQLLSK